MKRTNPKSTNIMFYMSRGVWVASWFYDGGRRKSMRLPAATDKATAQEEYQRWRTAVPAPIVAPPPVESSQKSVQTMISVFERQVMPSYRATTQAIYRQMFGLLTKAGIRFVDDFRAEKLRSLKDVLITEHMGPAQQHKMLRTARRFMRWGNEVGYLMTVPKVSFPRVRKKSKGRPLTDTEFQALLKATDAIYHLKPERAEGCKRLLRGLWLSGLRVGEADLSWDDREGFHVDWTSHRRPVFVMPDTIDKTAQARVFPMTPDFWALISAVPESERTGPVFTVLSTWRGQRLNTQRLSRLIERIGEKSGVIVDRKGDDVKYASAHDLRRSFGLRWAQKVNQIQLGALMRHSDPKTTATYYIGADASRLLDGIW